MKKAHYTFDFDAYLTYVSDPEWLGCIDCSKPRLTKKDFDNIQLTLTGEIMRRPWRFVVCRILRNSRQIGLMQILRCSDRRLEIRLVRTSDSCVLRNYAEEVA